MLLLTSVQLLCTAILLLAACSAKRDEPRQRAPVAETRTSLACAPGVLAHVPVRPDAVTGASDHDDDRDNLLDHLTRADLIAFAKPGELVPALVRRIDRAAATGATLAPIERELTALTAMYGDVLAGGFRRFFHNPSGDAAAAARSALVRFAISDFLPVYDCALTAFPDATPSPERKQRLAQLAAWGAHETDLFDPLDHALFRLPSSEPAVEAYVRAHLGELPAR